MGRMGWEMREKREDLESLVKIFGKGVMGY